MRGHIMKPGATPAEKAFELMKATGSITFLMLIPLSPVHLIFGGRESELPVVLVIADWIAVLGLLCTAIALIAGLVLTLVNSEVRQDRNLSAACLAAMLLAAAYASYNYGYDAGYVTGHDAAAQSRPARFVPNR
jgi:hypothetical protein